MTPKSTWTLVALAALLFGFIFVFERHWRPAGPAAPAPRLLPQLDPALLTSLQVRPAGKPDIHVDHSNGVWTLTLPLTYPAEGEAVDGLLHVLRQLNGRHRLGAEELRSHKHVEKEFGFAPPQFSILAQQGDEVTQVLVGNLTPLKDQVFVQVVGLPGIFLVEAALLEWIPRSADDWRSGSLADLKAAPFDRVAVTNGATALELERDPATRQWRILRPMPARADSPRIDALLEKLQGLRIASFVADDPKADLETYGLAPPNLELTFSRGTNLLAALQFGRSPTNNAALVYARRALTGNVVLTPAEPLTAWRAPVADFRDRRLLALAPELISEIELRGPEPFLLQRLTNGAWQVTGTNGCAADLALVADLLNNLATLEVAQFVKDVVTPLGLTNYGLATPVQQVALRGLLTPTPGVTTNALLAELNFGARLGDLVFARRSDEDAVYGVKLRDFLRLPVAAWQLRDRRVFHFTTNDVASVRARLAERAWDLVRVGPNQWSVPTNAPAGLNDLALDEVLHQLGSLTCAGWVGCGPQAAAHYDIAQASPALTIELKSGERLQLQFGGLSPRQFPCATATVEGQLRVFEVPWTVFQTVQNGLGFLFPGR
jgi:hypothetical protein